MFGANGHLEEEINKVQESQHYEQPPQLLWNCGPQFGDEFEIRLKRIDEVLNLGFKDGNDH